MYDQYGKILSAAAKKLKMSNSQKYKLHIDGVKAGDEDFDKEFENYITKQLKTYMESENAVYPEFDGYKLENDPVYGSGSGDSNSFLNLKKDLFSTVAGAFHIPESMMTGNITAMDEIVGSFLTFGVDPYADMITEALNKRAGMENYASGNYYQVDTSKIIHRDIFSVSADISNLISSGVKCIDEVREMIGDAPLNTEWSRKHFITKNFEEIERFLKNPEEGGGNE
jgi:HK97 family phage portal protein